RPSGRPCRFVASPPTLLGSTYGSAVTPNIGARRPVEGALERRLGDAPRSAVRDAARVNVLSAHYRMPLSCEEVRYRAIPSGRKHDARSRRSFIGTLSRVAD